MPGGLTWLLPPTSNSVASDFPQDLPTTSKCFLLWGIAAGEVMALQEPGPFQASGFPGKVSQGVPVHLPAEPPFPAAACTNPGCE